MPCSNSYPIRGHATSWNAPCISVSSVSVIILPRRHRVHEETQRNQQLVDIWNDHCCYFNLFSKLLLLIILTTLPVASLSNRNSSPRLSSSFRTLLKVSL